MEAPPASLDVEEAAFLRGSPRGASRLPLATVAGVTLSLESALFQWEDGYRKLESARSNPGRYSTLGRAVRAIQDELRKRLGSTFSVEELAAVYNSGTDWGLEVAIEAVPSDEAGWDSATVVDAAFYLYMREAANFAGGSVMRTSAGG